MRVVFRVDASPTIGSGHVMRCLALAQECKAQNMSCLFITSTNSPLLTKRLHQEGFEIVETPFIYPDYRDLQTTQLILKDRPGSWLVADGYHFDRVYQEQLKKSGCRLIVVDDNAELDHYYADVILNHNVHGTDLSYDCEPDTRLLLGNRYALLRQEYRCWQGWQRDIPATARKILVTMGGADPQNTTSKVIEAVTSVDQNFKIKVVIGSTNPHFKELQMMLDDIDNDVQMICNAQDMSELMAWADIAVSAGGVTAWEMAFMGLPNLIIVLAENQIGNVDKLTALGAARNLGWHENLTAQTIADNLEEIICDQYMRDDMSHKGRMLIDGNGPARVLMKMMEEPIWLRKVRSDDCRIIWEWANEPIARKMSFISEPIPWENHCTWFHTRLNDPNCRMYVGIDESEHPAGLVRYEIDEDAATVGVSVDTGLRGKGIASNLLRISARYLFSANDINTINAFIKPENTGSLKAFTKAGYSHVGRTKVSGHDACHYVLHKA
ncbi:MAG: UDP-2,4-diacetamido-2,4,6-trideoxy-beta-L-altropyranose hydrolase [Candidatus Saccharibacteria bacterium]